MTSTVPLVSIVIPAYNAEAYVDEAIASALAQTHPRIEVVVVDDGSTDGTAAALAAWSGRITAITKTNGGTASARNAGARAATGEWVVFLDADDKLRPEFVARCLRHLSQHPEAGYVYTQERFFGQLEYDSAYPDFDARALVHTNFVNPSALLPLDLVRAHPYTEAQRTHEDWDFYLGLLRQGVHGTLLDEVLKDYRRHPQAKQEVASKYQLRMPIARLRIHVRHRDLLGHDTLPLLADDVRRVARGAWRGGRTALGLALRRGIRR